MKFVSPEVFHPNGTFFSLTTLFSYFAKAYTICPVLLRCHLTPHSLSQWSGLHLHSASARRRSAPLRTGFGAVVTYPERGEDSTERHEHASRAQRRESRQCGGSEDVAGAERGVRRASAERGAKCVGPIDMKWHVDVVFRNRSQSCVVLESIGLRHETFFTICPAYRLSESDTYLLRR